MQERELRPSSLFFSKRMLMSGRLIFFNWTKARDFATETASYGTARDATYAFAPTGETHAFGTERDGGGSRGSMELFNGSHRSVDSDTDTKRLLDAPTFPALIMEAVAYNPTSVMIASLGPTT